MELIEKIKRAYPKGLIDEPCEEAFVSSERDNRLQRALDLISYQCTVDCCLDQFNKPRYHFALTQKNHPSFDKWIWMMKNEEKILWIRKNNEPYPVFWLNISRIADYYYFYYNHWVPRGDTGYLEADCKKQPNGLWLGFEKIIRSNLEIDGFIYLTDDLAREKTPYVLESDSDSIPDDDPRWDDLDFEPPLIASTIHRCLFGEC